jgi:AcrR family transcriptional regulator
MKNAAPQDTAEQIAEVARELLQNGGPEAVSMRAVAQAVGITPMAIYHHFRNREALLQEVTNREFDLLLGFIEARRAALPARAKLRTAMLQLMHGYIDYAMERPLMFDYVFSKERPGARRFPEDFRARRSPTMNPLADTVEAAMNTGYLKKDDVWEVAMQLTGLTHGYLVLYRGGRFNYTDREFRAFCERAMDRMIDGFGARES